MVEMIDTNVGRVVDQLEKDSELENTVNRSSDSYAGADVGDQVVIFMSDK